MANEWQSLLPSAWKPQDPNTQVQAAKAGAETALTNAQTATQAVDAVARNQERIRKQALQDVIAKSVRTTMGPDGKLIKVIDQDRFFEAMSKSPAAADAYDKFVAVAYPQMQREEVQRGLSSAITPEGGMDATKLAAAAQRSRFGSDIVNAAAEQQKTRLAGAEAQATSLTGINALTTSPAGAAPPGTIVGNTQMQPRVFGAQSAASGVAADRISADVVSQLSGAGREAALYNLKAKGVVLPAAASDADIADAANRVADAQVASESVAGADLQKPISLATSVFQTSAREPSIRQKVYGDIFGGALDYTGKKIANTRAGIETEGLAAGVAKTEDLAKKLLIPSSAIGSKVSPEMQARIDQADDAVNALAELKENMAGIVKEIDSGKINPNTPDGSKRLVADLVAQIGVINRIYGTGSTEGGVERALIDIGAPPDLANAIATHGVDAVKTWVSGKTINWRGLLADAPKRAVHSVTGALTKAKSSDPARVLRNAGHSDIMPKEHLKPSVFIRKPAKSTPNDPLGILGGAK